MKSRRLPLVSTFGLLLSLHSAMPSPHSAAGGHRGQFDLPLSTNLEVEHPGNTQCHNGSLYGVWQGPYGSELHPFFEGVYQAAEESRCVGSRSKRSIRLFPAGSQFLTKYSFKIPTLNVTMYKSSFSFDLYAYFPFPNYLLAQRRKRGVSAPSRADPLQRRAKEIEKMKVFSQIEDALDGWGLSARDCLLRFLCDVAEAPFFNGLFGDIINSILRTSFHPNDLEEGSSMDHVSEDYRPFLEAEKHGLMKGGCEARYSECSTSLSNILTSMEKMYSF